MEKRLDTDSRAERYDLRILGSIVLENPGMGEEKFLGNTVNISLSGALVETGREFPVGSLMKYRFNIPGVEKTFNLTAEVVRKAAYSDSGVERGGAEADANGPDRQHLNLYGIRFLDMNGEDRSAIAGYLFK
ncbi:MAG: PilZ domain-containing protein [Thermodesulfobacteriota bacterium]